MPEGSKKHVLITGASGTIGGALVRYWQGRYDLTCLTHTPTEIPGVPGDQVHAADIADLDIISPFFEGVDAVVHLAASPNVETPWEDVLHNNIAGARSVFEAARMAGVRAVVFASSNHAIGMYEVDAAPGLYALDDERVFDHTVEVRPDSLYGVSKAFGEALGRYYSDNFNMRVICVRIGTVRADDDPCASSVAEHSGWLPLSKEQKYERLRATWLSQRDCAQLLATCVDRDDVKWAVVYGVSGNPRQFWDISHARKVLGYEPQDSAPEHCGE